MAEKSVPAGRSPLLDTHDGIGVVDVEDLMTPEEIEKTVNGSMRKAPMSLSFIPARNTRTWTFIRSTARIIRRLKKTTIPISRPAPSSFLPRAFCIYYVGFWPAEMISAWWKRPATDGTSTGTITIWMKSRGSETARVQRLRSVYGISQHLPGLDGELTINDSPESQ
ncbi:MAG: hypothetical protein R2860_10715 [Desulfobacterales bacterium]